MKRMFSLLLALALVFQCGAVLSAVASDVELPGDIFWELDPTEPTDPTDTTEPTDPTDATDPTDPTDATDPTDPSEPTDVTEPTDPTDPTEPTEPDQEEPPKMTAFYLDPSEITCSFVDVPENSWYYPFAAYGQSLGLISGKGGGRFAPEDTITYAEGIALGVRVYEAYWGITPENDQAPGESWYMPYVRRAQTYGILPETDCGYTENMTRALSAALIASVLPQEELTVINKIIRLPDVDNTNPYYPQIIALYAAGILSGSDEYGTFRPNDQVMRSEFTKILSALINVDLRSHFTLHIGSLEFFAGGDGTDTCSFTDVAANVWYYPYVAAQETIGIIQGVGGNRFAPDGTVSLAQVIVTAVRVYDIYYDVEEPVPSGNTWYDGYVQRALEYGIISTAYSDYNANASRAQVVQILYNVLPTLELEAINQVNALPDITSSDSAWTSVITFYRAGVLSGKDAYGTFGGAESITRAELAAILTRLVRPSTRMTFTLQVKPTQTIETINFGTSGSGKYTLSATRIGSGKNVMVLNFAIHGWEDNYNKDGAELVYLADQTISYLKTNYSLVANNDWSVYVIRCANPDGLYTGTTCNGPGRCTTYYYNSSGKLIYGNGKGIDMNRCFPYNYKSMTSSRNFNGTAPLQCAEARALSTFVQSVKGSGKNICIDTHGWFSQIITSSGKGKLYKAFYAQFSGNSYASLSGASGYFTSWTAYSVGYDSCLFELPRGIYSHSAFVSSGYVGKFQKVISNLVQTY